MTTKGRNQSRAIGEDLSQAWVPVAALTLPLLIDPAQGFCSNSSARLLCLGSPMWVSGWKVCHLLYISQAWAPIPDRLQDAALPMEEEREGWGHFSAQVHKAHRN